MRCAASAASRQAAIQTHEEPPSARRSATRRLPACGGIGDEPEAKAGASAAERQPKNDHLDPDQTEDEVDDPAALKERFQFQRPG